MNDLIGRDLLLQDLAPCIPIRAAQNSKTYLLVSYRSPELVPVNTTPIVNGFDLRPTIVVLRLKLQTMDCIGDWLI
jgi:hypothetical protein